MVDRYSISPVQEGRFNCLGLIGNKQLGVEITPEQLMCCLWNPVNKIKKLFVYCSMLTGYMCLYVSPDSIVNRETKCRDYLPEGFI